MVLNARIAGGTDHNISLLLPFTGGADRSFDSEEHPFDNSIRLLPESMTISRWRRLDSGKNGIVQAALRDAGDVGGGTMG